MRSDTVWGSRKNWICFWILAAFLDVFGSFEPFFENLGAVDYALGKGQIMFEWIRLKSCLFNW